MKIRQLAVLLLVSAGCLRSPQAVESPTEFTEGYISVFEKYESKCPYFAHKAFDWKALGYTYFDLVAECSTEDEAIDLISDMLAELQDPFIRIIRNYGGGNRGVTYPFTREYYSNYDMDVLVENYLEPNGWAGWEDGYVQGFGWCDPSVLPYFFLDTLPTSEYTSAALDSLDVFIVNCIALDVPAVIVDVRMNPFGCSENLFGSSGMSFMGRFTGKSRPGAIYRSRDGLEYDMYIDRRPAVFQAGAQHYTGTVIVLVGENCISWSENMLANFINFPNVVLVGDTTGGSVSTGYEVSVTQHCRCTVVSGTILTYDKLWIEGAGLPPDIFVEATEADFAAGVDPVLDYAISMLNGYSR